ncbi:MAG: T9SS type A sorting domain-containing protein [Ferruginibacter sp.]
MSRNLLFTLLAAFALPGLQAQVTQINSNRSLSFDYPLTNNKSIYVSNTDSTIWATDGTLAGTIQLSTTIKFVGSLGSIVFLDGKLIFSGNTPATGPELFITDGTPGGTALIVDINPGPAGSAPDNDYALLNGYIYFTAERAAEGRELWRTNGTAGGTSLVKDIVPGPVGSNNPGNYELFSTGTYLLFAARTASSGIELWKSDGTTGGTALLKDINTGNAGADSSNPRMFYLLNSTVLFLANNGTNGEEFWRTDGTAGGTTILADINPGSASSTGVEVIPGFTRAIFSMFRTYNNRAFFIAFDGTSTGELWSTNGVAGNATLIKDIVPGLSFSFILLADAVDVPGKFIFPVADQAGRSELWQSDGTAGGTVLFKAFSPTTDENIFPIVLVPYTFTSGFVAQSLYQGNKFFFMASSATEGYELWISDGVDGTAAHTSVVKDINPGVPDGVGVANASYIYTSAGLYFAADNGVNGPELWKSDGTPGGTSMVADIITGLPGSKPSVDFFLVNGKILFEADNGDDPNETDLFAVNGTFTPVPIKLTDFTVITKSADGILNWRTSQEVNSRDFTVQRSFDGADFQNIGKVAAAGTSANVHAYTFTDAGILNSGKSIVYYRLLTTDKDGKITLSPVIALKTRNTAKWTVRLLANPVPENIQVVLSGVTDNVQLSIIDMTGKKLYTGSLLPVNGQVSLPAGTLAKGTYILVAESGNERKAIQFVK